MPENYVQIRCWTEKSKLFLPERITERGNVVQSWILECWEHYPWNSILTFIDSAARRLSSRVKPISQVLCSNNNHRFHERSTGSSQQPLRRWVLGWSIPFVSEFLVQIRRAVFYRIESTLHFPAFNVRHSLSDLHSTNSSRLTVLLDYPSFSIIRHRRFPAISIIHYFWLSTNLGYPPPVIIRQYVFMVSMVADNREVLVIHLLYCTDIWYSPSSGNITTTNTLSA